MGIKRNKDYRRETHLPESLSDDELDDEMEDLLVDLSDLDDLADLVDLTLSLSLSSELNTSEG